MSISSQSSNGCVHRWYDALSNAIEATFALAAQRISGPAALTENNAVAKASISQLGHVFRAVRM